MPAKRLGDISMHLTTVPPFLKDPFFPNSRITHLWSSHYWGSWCRLIFDQT